MRKAWTDERLDYLNHRVDDGFRKVDGRFDRVDGELGRVNDRIGAMQRSMLQVGGGVIVALIGLIATQL